MKIWSHTNGELIGHGNGFRAHVYETQGFPEFDVEPIWTVLIHDCHKRVNKHQANSQASVKRWAEKKYLRGT